MRGDHFQRGRLSSTAIHVRAFWVLALLGVSGPVSGDLADGIAAFAVYDYATAVEVLTPLAEAGDVAAMYYLASIRNPLYEAVYLENFIDVEEAIHWYSVAAEAGDPYSMFHLGRLLAYENRRSKNRLLLAKTYPLLKTRAESGDGLAALMAWRIRPGNYGVHHLLALSRKLLEKEARKGDSTAQLHLADAFLRRHDLVVRREAVKAFAWATVALRNGNRHALYLQREAAGRLRKREHARAEALAALLIENPAAPYPDDDWERNGTRDE